MTFQVRQWVRAGDGRLGLIDKLGARKAVVQFGPDGPFEHLLKSSLRAVTVQEVRREREGISGLALDMATLQLVEC